MTTDPYSAGRVMLIRAEAGLATCRPTRPLRLPRGLAAATALVALYAAFALVSRAGLGSGSGGGFGPLDLAAFRLGLGGLALAPFLLAVRRPWPPLRRVALPALFGGPVFAGLAYGGLSFAPAAHGSVLMHGALPLSTAVAALALTGARPARAALAGLALIVAGLVAMTLDSFAASSAQLLGDAMLLGASLSWGVFAVSVARLGLPAPQAAALVAAPWVLTLGLPWLALSAERLLAAPAAALVGQALFQGVAIGAGSTLAYAAAVARLGPARVALAMAAVPPLTALSAAALLDEPLTAAMLTGVALAGGGVAMASGTLFRETMT